MTPRGLLMLTAVALPLFAGAVSPPQVATKDGRDLFVDDFESGLDRWEILGDRGVSLRDTDDARHETVLELTPNGDDVAALIRGSGSWSAVRVEGEMLFPTGAHSYLGLLYHHTTRGPRRDFGLVYVKGNDSYLQVNPHRDLNVSRLIYPEFHVPLDGPSAVEIGVWQRFAFEVSPRTVHVYIGDTTVPQLTFDGFELDRGEIGLQPRSVGGPVWIDNVRVRRLERPSYAGPPIPNPEYAPDHLLTAWQAAGPFAGTNDAIARNPDAPEASWSPAPVDWRGAVVTARTVDFHGPRRVAYFRTSVTATEDGSAELQLSSADDLALWINGHFAGFYARQAQTWFDFAHNPEHAGRSIPVELVAGRNDIVLRAIGGVYASGGFFARLHTR